jgi:polyisoprenoid-binding protein YceI
MKQLNACFVAFALCLVSPASAQPSSPTASPSGSAKATALAAPLWAVDQRASSIGFTGSMDGIAFSGRFTKWNAGIRFDPSNLAGSAARVIVEPASVNSGDGSRDSTLKESDWFDTARSPHIIFQTTSIRSVGSGRYEAIGTLSVKGRAIPLTLPFTLTINGAQADMRASIVIDRTRLGLGAQFDPSGTQVAKAVTVNIAVRATRTP